MNTNILTLTDVLTTEDAKNNSAERIDFELAKLAGEGDIGAFEKIYLRYHQRTYSLCLRMLKNTFEAEDMTQEVYLQLFRKIGQFRGDSAFNTWLHRLTVNQVLMHFRKSSVKNEETMREEGGMPDLPVRGTENPLRMAINDNIALRNAMAELPNGYRNVFYLHDVLGHEHEEVGKILGCSTGTSKSQLHKARLKLQKLLKKKANPRYSVVPNYQTYP